MKMKQIHPTDGEYFIDGKFNVGIACNDATPISGVFANTDKGVLYIYRSGSELWTKLLDFCERVEEVSIDIISNSDFVLIGRRADIRFRLAESVDIDMFPLPNDFSNWLLDVFKNQDTRSWFIEKWRSV